MTRWRPRILFLLAVTSLYLYGYPSATLTYSGVLLFHLVAGIALTILLVPYFLRNWRDEKFLSRLGWSALALGAIRDGAGRDGGIKRRRMVDEEYGLEECVPRDKSAAFHRDDGRGRRRAAREILSELRADTRREKYSGVGPGHQEGRNLLAGQTKWTTDCFGG